MYTLTAHDTRCVDTMEHIATAGRVDGFHGECGEVLDFRGVVCQINAALSTAGDDDRLPVAVPQVTGGLARIFFVGE